ncbi:MAG: maltodextrin phosphorylase [Firmicutes bacterium]|nr:maltodextrin phosphorylase [Bacillota bacterium]
MSKEKEYFKQAFIARLESMHGKTVEEASAYDKYTALGSLLRDRIGKTWVETNRQYDQSKEKQVYYFSIEFLLGRLLDTNLENSGVKAIWVKGLEELGVNYDELIDQEHDAGLGNGGLGRLAACFLDSFSALKMPGHGCGIRYKYGLFTQKIVDGDQIEYADNWLKNGNIWEFKKIDKAVKVQFGDSLGTILAVPYDIPIIGFDNEVVNTLRLWSAEALDSEFDYNTFNQGNYAKAVEYKYSVEAISEILYPDDSHYEGRLLRLKQQYFFVSAGLKSIIRYLKKNHPTIRVLPEKVAIHINDTHPALAVPELMRILIDEEGLEWEEAWEITVKTISYTNHTIMPEALEKWPVDIFRSLLPRIYDIIHEINERFCQALWQHYPGEWSYIAAMAIIADNYIRMANLAVVGSHSVNGVAELHTAILKKDIMRPFYQLMPEKFNNKTNGITHRRWLLHANPELAALISKTIGSGWVKNATELNKLIAHVKDADFRAELAAVKLQKKKALAKFITDKYGETIDEKSIFDIQVKRIHAYKRQLLNALGIMDLYNRLKENPALDIVPRTFIFAGKAAPGYLLAKKVVKLISILANVINNDPVINNKLKVIFIENYGVSLAELIIPAADVSEQISTASKEASGTGNMKFMMNGAVTLGTLDGANVEIQKAVGANNIVIFGLSADEVIQKYTDENYNSRAYYSNNSHIQKLVDQLIDGTLPGTSQDLQPLYNHLVYGNGEFFELVDLQSYIEAQTKIDNLFRHDDIWWEIVVNNIAHSGIFSSDNTINEYANEIWHIRPLLKRQ